ncbi:MAG: GerMN domain-containing protein [Lachnospiraceae bacterium]|nr:GerMN domain-containing protein [Lachnospiraceae bacterium]
MNKIKYAALFFLMLILAGCGNQKQSLSKEYLIYTVDKDENKVDSYSIDVEETETKEVLQVLFRELQKSPESASSKSAIPEGVEIIGFSLHEDQLTLDFNVNYRDMNPILEVLSRAAIVRTLCQVEGIRFVSFNIEGEPYANANGYLVGMMSQDQFVDNAGDEINSMEKADLTLYFADESGNYLQAKTIECIYNSNISLDKLVVERLIAGPEDGDGVENGFATISSDTQIMSVTTQDGVCYVNLNEGFLVRQGNVTPEVAVYSIVNSLTELPGVNRVQLSIEGNSDLNYMEKLSLLQPFEKNMEIIDNAQ